MGVSSLDDSLEEGFTVQYIKVYSWLTRELIWFFLESRLAVQRYVLSGTARVRSVGQRQQISPERVPLLADK